MVREYSTEKIREKLIDALSQSKTGLTGVEISEKLKVNRVTMSKYLRVFAGEGLIKQKNMGSVNLWFIEEGADKLNFPADFFQVKNKYLEYVLSGSTPEAHTLIRTSLHSGATPTKLVSEVIIPAIESIENSYDSGKMGRSEKNFYDEIISTSISLIGLSEEEVDQKKNIVILSSDYQNALVAQAASGALRTEKWKVSLLGDMSSAIDVMFDIDLQRFLNKIWPKRDGIMIIVVFASKEAEIKFFTQAIEASKGKYGKNIHLALCTRIGKKTKTSADFVSADVETLLQWCQTVYESYQNQ
ncbi:transcriptional regulator [Candidatus Nitrosotalea bavarica]|uniref:transcriptional regulator n=1 Tax=Candidatus Nitrosotalea bavarica TaxID=1903277 RepID=UPI000C713832|nr:transcriptional regulator [Candidatus Nitrosotalea bavarica]